MTTEAARVAEVEGTHSSAHACTHGIDDACRYLPHQSTSRIRCILSVQQHIVLYYTLSTNILDCINTIHCDSLCSNISLLYEYRVNNMSKITVLDTLHNKCYCSLYGDLCISCT